MKKSIIFSIAFVLFVANSCSQDYDLSNMDKNICVGGENFVFPLGNSTKMVPDSLLNFSNIKELQKDDQGNYFFNYSGTITQEISFLSLARQICLPDQKMLKTIEGEDIPVLEDAVLDLYTFPLTLEFSGFSSFPFSYDLSPAAGEGLVRLDSLIVLPSNIAVEGKLSSPDFTTIPSGINMEFDFKVPAIIKTSDDRQVGDIIKVPTQIATDGKTDVKPVTFVKMDLSGSADFKYQEDITVNAIRIEIPDKTVYKAVMGHQFSLDLSISVIAENGGVITPEILYGLVSRDAEPIDEVIDITGIPDYMREGILDLKSPLLGLKVTTNATVPVSVDADMTSWSSAAVTGSASASIITDYVTTPYQEVTSKYLLANEDISASGYEFVQTDLRSLVKTVPDAIELSVIPATDTSVTSNHVVFVTEDADVEVQYDFSIPLVFGAELNTSFRDTITNMPEMLGDVLSKRDIYLIGDATSTLPMDLTLQANFLDVNGNSLEIRSSETKIKGTSDPETPAAGSFSMDVKKSSDAKKISKLELILTMKNGQSVSLTANNYVQLSLQVSVPGGVELEIDND